MTRLAGPFDSTRFERRPWGTGKLGISFTHWSISSDDTPGLVSFEMRNDEPVASDGCPKLETLIIVQVVLSNSTLPVTAFIRQVASRLT